MTLRIVMAATILAASIISASDWEGGRVDAHAPIGVMGEHTHHGGGWMLSYRYMTMGMAGNRQGQQAVSVSNLFSDTAYMVAPLRMDMTMHMFGAMIAPTDKLTIMAMLPYIGKQMSHRRKSDGSEFTRRSAGLGDANVSAIYEWQTGAHHKWLLNAGLSLPLGSIDEKDGQTTRLPYPMQLGSGTTDLTLGATVAQQASRWSFGGQGLFTTRLGDNANGYNLGNRYTGTVWTAYVINDEWSASLRAIGELRDNISGQDSTLNQNMVPTATSSQGGKRVDMALGLNYFAKSGYMGQQRFALELIVPALQSVNGVQLQQTARLVLGWQRAF